MKSTLAPAGLIATLRAAGCVFAEDEARLLIESAHDSEHLNTLLAQRIAGDPLEQVLGWVDFAGLRISLAPGVFVPRQRTELLIQQAVSVTRARPGPIVVLDLCCGSGALGVALADQLPRIELHAADIDPVAVACARRNVEPIGGRVYLGDLFAPLPAPLKGRVDILAANAPYVPTAAITLMPREARLYEPQTALDGGADGCQVIRRLMSAARDWLAPGGCVLVESSESQTAELETVVSAAGLGVTITRDEERGATVVAGSRPR